tara:strand:- start:5902 stop:6912 length:1011 start_codon:yes stop_codon:yes gene_type:complete
MQTLQMFYELNDNPNTKEDAQKFYKGFSHLAQLIGEMRKSDEEFVSQQEMEVYSTAFSLMLEREYGIAPQRGILPSFQKSNNREDIIAMIDAEIDIGAKKYNIEPFDYEDILDFYNATDRMPNIDDPIERSADLLQYIDVKKEKLVSNDGLLLTADAKLDDMFDDLKIGENFLGADKYVGTLADDLMGDYSVQSQLGRAVAGVPKTYFTTSKAPEYVLSKIGSSMISRRLSGKKGVSLSPDDIYEPQIEDLIDLNMKTEEIQNYDNYIPSDKQLKDLTNSINNNLPNLSPENVVSVQKNLPEYINMMSEAKETLDNISNAKKILDVQVKLAKERNE